MRLMAMIGAWHASCRRAPKGENPPNGADKTLFGAEISIGK